ncbi:MAG: LysE/ArgO family amino acid transporter [Microbacterium gubbeenense]
MLTALPAGLGLCLSIIAAPGAQNVFLLREGIRHAGGGRRHALALAAVCLASDVVLISVGVGGFGVVVEQVPWLFDAARWAGVVFLAGYGMLAAIRAVRGGEAIETGSPDPARQEPAPTLASGTGATATLTAVPVARVRTAMLPAILTCLAITWLNPHTYLDTVLLLGSISTHYGDARWLFAVGAILGSAVWFAILTFAARFASRWLRSPRSWRILDAGVAVMMLGLATALAVA